MQSNKPIASLYRHISSRRRRQLASLMILMLVGAVAELASLGAVLPFLTLLANPSKALEFPLLQEGLARLGLTAPEQLILPATVLFIVVVVLATAIRIVLNWASNNFVFGLGYDIGVEVYRRTLYQPYRYHVARNTSEIIAGTNKVQVVINNVLLPLMQSMVSGVIALAILAALFMIDPVVAGTAGGIFGGVYLLITVTIRRRLRINSKIIAVAQSKRVQVVQEGLGGIRDVLIDSAQKIYLRRFESVDGPMRHAQSINNLIGTTPRFLLEASGMILIAGLAYFITQRDGGLIEALPVLGALALGAQRLLPLLQAIYQGWTKVAGNRALIGDVVSLLEQEIPPEYEVSVAVPGLRFERELALRGVSYRYNPGSAPVLDGLDLRIAKGMRVGFVGKTGSGKSTLLDLIMGLLEPAVGAVEVDGTPITPENRLAWHAHIAHVPQTIYLSDATIAENIAFGMDLAHINQERLRRAASEAQIDSYVESLPESYNTLVGERGVRLSGGQRQRIGIARALFKGADVLVFDEATSALDDATETAVMKSIDGLGCGITILMIAHRISTLKNCDLIVEMRQGKIVSTGSYEEFRSRYVEPSETTAA